MTPLQVLEAAEAALKAGLVRTEVLADGVTTTPSLPYVDLSVSTAFDRSMLSGDPEHDRVTLRARSVGGSRRSCLIVAQNCRRILHGLTLDRGPLLFDFATEPLDEDDPGDRRCSSVAEYVAHVDP